jgi:hypothetical protein
MKYIVVILAFTFAALAQLPSTEPTVPPIPIKLTQVHKIYVSPLGDNKDVEIIRQKIMGKLIQSGLFRIVESPSEADAQLVGIAVVNAGHSFGWIGAGGGASSASAAVRLIGPSREILWAGEGTQGFFGRSATSNVANNVVKSLVRAIELAQYFEKHPKKEHNK